MSDTDLPDPIAAATLVIFRDTSGTAEVLMVERAKAMTFAGGAMVFPGGRVDAADRALAAQLGGDPDEIAARIAAIRETIEEAGIPIGICPMPDRATLTHLRAALHENAGFGDILADAGLTIDLDALIPFARWRPAHAHRRIFDARFYLARLPKDAPDAQVDATENVGLVWAPPRAILDEADAGRMQIIFPTRRNLERLAQFGTYDAAVAHARATPVTTIVPWTENRGGTDYLCIPEDAGYPVTSERLTSALRG